MYGVIQNAKRTMTKFKTFYLKQKKKKQKLGSKWVIGKHNIIYLQRQNDTVQVQIFKN